MRPITPSRFFVCLSSLALVYGCGTEDPFEDLAAGSGGGSGDTGGATGSGGTATGGGTQNSGGSGNAGGGSTGGGASGGAGNSGGGPPAGGGPAAGGGTGDPAGGGPAAGGGTGSGGAPDVDQEGKSNAVPGETTDVVQDYLRLGEIRILNNNWGSAELGCNAPTSTMDVYVDNEGSFGWHFFRGNCAADGPPANTSQPDFPQVEFGIHPFGIGHDLVTSPEFSSTTLLPLQLKDITSASVTVDQFTLTLGGQGSWNSTMEFWLSEGDPRLPSGQVQVHTEVMAWWGWNGNRWPCDEPGGTDGSNGSEGQSVEGYTVCHQSETWAGNKWRYYQFRSGGSSPNFNGTINVGAFLQYLRDKGYSPDLWLTRMEVGTEIDDDTDGTVKMNGITFEVNGESRSAIIGTP